MPPPPAVEDRGSHEGFACGEVGGAFAFEAAEKAVDLPDKDRPAEPVHVREQAREIRVAAKGADRPHARRVSPHAEGGCAGFGDVFYKRLLGQEILFLKARISRG